ncbi:hypothetical protein L1987_35619 [Smallanthus sonchifolius]|uniref:Uncharacterized protein n=1 Tax=Smallanthus sonchifolius TaxID=185202 RepID=A0ACB9HBR5_9ASTR|nr:hypothetical protein L1987_35619 [Smallanthus sonchifolius]
MIDKVLLTLSGMRRMKSSGCAFSLLLSVELWNRILSNASEELLIPPMSIDVLLSISHHLSTPTQFFGLKQWITIVFCIGLLILIIICLCISFIGRRKEKLNKSCGLGSSRMMDRRLLSRRGWDIQTGVWSPMVYSGHSNWFVDMPPAVTGGAGRCKSYSATELHLATDGFSQENMINNGEVYRGILLDGKRVAVKKFISNSDNVDEFVEQVEAVWCIRHKNVVKLLGYSIEGAKRMLVYDYIDNGDLHQWLHGRIGRVSPLTWNIQMNIILGITKGLVYLHEYSEPIVIHQHLKSTNPSLPELPSSKELKRITLIALRCVDPEVENRPTIGDIWHPSDPLKIIQCMIQPSTIPIPDLFSSYKV